ncbi:MAG: O-antigen polymerase [Bryobacteraceae bacterium]
MLILIVLLLAALAVMNYRLAHSLLYPPALYATLWSLFLLALFLSGNTFYPISGDTMTVYLVGAVAFSVGGLLIHKRGMSSTQTGVNRRFVSMVLNGGLLLLVVALPFYWEYIQELAAASLSPDFWYGVRVESIARSEEWSKKSLSALLLENISAGGILFALGAVADGARTRWQKIRLALLVTIALAYQLMMAASSAAVFMALAIIGIDAMRRRRLRIKAILVGSLILAVSFSAVAIYLNKGATRSDASLLENVGSLVELFEWYALGGVVSFDRVVQQPGSIPAAWSIWRVFMQTANKFGAGFDVQPLHAEYTMISPTMESNVYTIYFAYYPEYGLLGVMAIMVFLGAALTWIYRRAAAGNPKSILLYGLALAGMALSGFNEQFFITLNFWFKALVFGLVLYRLPAFFRRTANSISIYPQVRQGLYYRRSNV